MKLETFEYTMIDFDKSRKFTGVILEISYIITKFN